QGGLVVLAARHVMGGVFVQVGDFLVRELADDLADADDQGVVRNDAVFGNDGAGADQAVAPDDRIVQHDGLHAHQRAFVDGAAVQHGLRAHRYSGADAHGTAVIHVQHAAFLGIGALADQDGVVVAPDRDVRPDADAGLQRDIADD